MKTLKNLMITLLLIMTALLVWLPLWMLFSGSLMGSGELHQKIGPILEQSEDMASWGIFPLYPTLQPFVELLLDSPKFFVMFWNSCIQVLPVLAGQLLVAVPAAWAFARYNFRGKKLLFTLYILLMILPFQVTMVSSYLVLFRMKLIDSHLAIILPNIFSTFPVFIMVKFFKELPEALMEAARLDGASEGYIFAKIGIPLGAAGILSAVILDFIEYWNAIEQPLTFLIKNKSLWPMSLYLPNITTDKAGLAFAASFIMLLPALLLFLYGQKYLEQGIAATGLKG